MLDCQSQLVHVAKPKILLGFFDLMLKVFADLSKSRCLTWVNLKEVASHASMLVDAVRSVWTVTVSECDLSMTEVLNEVVPLFLSWRSVLVGWP